MHTNPHLEPTLLIPLPMNHLPKLIIDHMTSIPPLTMDHVAHTFDDNEEDEEEADEQFEDMLDSNNTPKNLTHLAPQINVASYTSSFMTSLVLPHCLSII